MRAVIGCDNTELRDQVRQLILNCGWQCTAEDAVLSRDLPLRLSQVPVEMSVVVVGNSREEAMGGIQYSARRAGVPVVAVDFSSSKDQERELLAAGARNVLEWGRLKDDLRAVLDAQLNQNGSRALLGRTLAVVGTNPGCGVTTVASSLAFALAGKHPSKVVLAELGAGVPELALDLGLEPTHSIADLVHGWDRLDHSAVRQSTAQHRCGVHLLGYPAETLAGDALEPPGVRQLTVLLRTLFEVSVLDLGHQITPYVAEAVRLAETVVVVMRLDVPGLRIARQLLRQLKSSGVPRERVCLIVNRYGQKQQLAWKKAEEHLDQKIVAWIPEDAGTVNYALNNGVPLIEASRRAKITRSFDQLAQQLNGKM